MAASRKGSSGARRAFVVIGIVAVLLAAALSGAWYFVAGEIDRRSADFIASAQARGTAIDCANRAVFGYPFRIGLACDALTVDAPGAEFRAAGGAIRTASQLYDPGRIVAEFTGPLLLDTRDLPPLDLRWTEAWASTRIGFDGMKRASVAVHGADAALAMPAGARSSVATADRVELHLRRREADLDLAGFDRGLRFTAPGVPDLPAIEASFDLSVAGAGAWLEGAMPRGGAREVLGGREGQLRSVKIDFGGPNLELSGPWRFSADGLLSGEFQLAIAEPERIADILATLVPDFAPIANQTASAVGFLGRRENGRSVLPLTVRDGAATLGVFPIGEIPPLQ